MSRPNTSDGEVQLPKMAGTGYSEMLSKDSYARQKHFDYKNGMPIVQEDSKSGYTAKSATTKLSLPIPATRADTQKNSTSNSSFTPSYVALDRKVLRFDAWFMEDVLNNPYEKSRVHKCTLLYYLVDDSLQVSEPKTLNAAMPQGTFLKRHRVPKGENGRFVSWEDLSVGNDIELYGRSFHLNGCDDFTRSFYQQNGITQGSAEGTPEDLYTQHREKVTEAPKRLPRYIDWNLRKKLNNPFAKRCLRFFACWDDRDHPFGEKRPFVVNFFLEDETIEVLEVHSPNDGRENFPRMLKRQKVPRKFEELADAFGDHIVAQDLMVGQHLSIFSRNFFLYACDDSTKEFMISNFGYSDADFPDLVDTVLEADEPLPEMPIPKHTGIGDPRDSIQSVYHLVPRVPRKDIGKLLKFEGKVIRWQAKLNSSNPDDEGRKFIISFSLADDTMSIFEPPIKNSGIIGGSFMSREKVWRPGFQYEEPYSYEDFQEGNIIVAHGHEFVLIQSDEYTKKLVAQIESDFEDQLAHAGAFSVLSPEEAMKMFKQKLLTRNKRAFVQFARVMDKDQSGTVSMEEMWEACKLFNIDINRKDMEAVLKAFDSDGSGDIDYREMARFMGEDIE